jgi:hypothetical protein
VPLFFLVKSIYAKIEPNNCSKYFKHFISLQTLHFELDDEPQKLLHWALSAAAGNKRSKHSV